MKKLALEADPLGSNSRINPDFEEIPRNLSHLVY